MNNEYTYEVTENGYFILINGEKAIHQYEPFIPNKNISYEENAKAQIKEMQINDYANSVEDGKTKIEDVPQDLKADVEKLIAEIEERKLKEPATKQEVTDIELALAEVYELIAGGAE